jgi:hypothetical protein
MAILPGAPARHVGCDGKAVDERDCKDLIIAGEIYVITMLHISKWQSYRVHQHDTLDATGKPLTNENARI